MCDVKTTEKGSLLKHIKVVHEGKRLSCSLCTFKTARKNRLQNHINLKHEDSVKEYFEEDYVGEIKQEKKENIKLEAKIEDEADIDKSTTPEYFEEEYDREIKQEKKENIKLELEAKIEDEAGIEISRTPEYFEEDTKTQTEF